MHHLSISYSRIPRRRIKSPILCIRARRLVRLSARPPSTHDCARNVGPVRVPTKKDGAPTAYFFFLCPHQPVGSSCSRHVLVITYWCSCSHHSLVLVLHYLLIPLPDTSFLFSLFSEKGDRPPGSGGLFSRRVWFGRPEVRGFDGSVGEGQRTAVVLRTAINYTGNSPRVDILKNRE